MDVRNLLLGLNGCESEIARIQNKSFVPEELSAKDKGMLDAYRERHAEIMKILDNSGYDLIFHGYRWFAAPRQKLEGVDAILSR